MENSKNKSITFLIKGSGAFVIINAVIECAVILYKNQVKVLSENFYLMMDIRNVFVIALFLLALLFVLFKRKELSNYIKHHKEALYSEMLNMANLVVPFIFLPGIIKHGLGLLNLLNGSTETLDLKMVVLNIVMLGIYIMAFWAVTSRKELLSLIKKSRK